MGQIIVDDRGRAITPDNRLPVDVTGAVQLSGSNLAEQRTEANLSGGSVTFTAPVVVVEIINLDTVNHGDFVVNGVSVRVPAGFTTGLLKVGTTPAANVAVTDSTRFIINRYA